MVDSDPRTLSLISRRMLPSSFRMSTVSMSLPLSGERTFPTLLLLTFRHRIGSCTSHSGVKKAHDWVVDQIADRPLPFNPQSENVKGGRNLGHRCGDIVLAGYLVNVTGPVSLVLDLLYASHMSVGVVALTQVLMDIYITRTIWIDH